MQQGRRGRVFRPNNTNRLLDVGVLQGHRRALVGLALITPGQLPIIAGAVILALVALQRLRALRQTAAVIVTDGRHILSGQHALLDDVPEKELLPVVDHLDQDGLDLRAQRLPDGERAALHFGRQGAVLEDPRHGGVGAAVAYILHVLQHGHLGFHVLGGPDGERDGVAVFLEAVDQIVLVAEPLHLFDLRFIKGNFAHLQTPFVLVQQQQNTVPRHWH